SRRCRLGGAASDQGEGGPQGRPSRDAASQQAQSCLVHRISVTYSPKGFAWMTSAVVGATVSTASTASQVLLPSSVPSRPRCSSLHRTCHDRSESGRRLMTEGRTVYVFAISKGLFAR